jgi:hypothetical protein
MPPIDLEKSSRAIVCGLYSKHNNSVNGAPASILIENSAAISKHLG